MVRPRLRAHKVEMEEVKIGELGDQQMEMTEDEMVLTGLAITIPLASVTCLNSVPKTG